MSKRVLLDLATKRFGLTTEQTRMTIPEILTLFKEKEVDQLFADQIKLGRLGDSIVREADTTRQG